MEPQTIIARILRKQRERFKIRDQEQADSVPAGTSRMSWTPATELLTLMVRDIQEALIAQGMVEIAHSFMKEAHPSSDAKWKE